MVYELFQQPDRENFRCLLEKVQGERNDIDFKTHLVEKDKLAKTVLAMANQRRRTDHRRRAGGQSAAGLCGLGRV